MTLLWWHWLVLGLLLVVAEVAAFGGFYLIFFGVAALVVGALSLFDLAGQEWIQVLLFSVLSIGSLTLFRKRLLHRFQAEKQRPPVDQVIGEVGVVVEDLAPGAIGRVELRGTSWTAQNDSGTMLAR